MKKLLSIVMSVLMLTGMLAMFAVPAMADGTDGGTTTEPQALVMYVSDSGLDTNDGLTAATAMQTIKAVVNKMKTTIGNGEGTYNSGTIILCGDNTISSSTDLGSHPAWPLTITSADKNNAKLILKNNFRMGGETLFTNIKIITATKGKYLWADYCNLTMGKEGVANDVVTYDTAAGSVEALTIAGGMASNSKTVVNYTVTVNSGTYKNIYTGEGTYGNIIDGNVKFIINNATVTGGVISMGGIYKSGAGVAGVYECTGDYTLVINGGTFTDTTISIGWAGTITQSKAVTLSDGSKLNQNDPSVNIFYGDVLLDINGGTFSGTSQIGKGGTLDAGMSGTVTYKKSVKIDISDIANANKATYKNLVAAADQTLVVEHTLDNFIKVDDNQHKAYCDCGCTNEELGNHAWNAGEITTSPTHTVNGEKTYTCVDCKATKTETIPADSTTHPYGEYEKHNETQHKRVCSDATCDATEYADHVYDEGVITQEPTHTEEGVKTYTCAYCGETKTEAIAKTTTHSMGDWEKHDENQHKRSCACGEAKYADHTWDIGVVTKQATEDAEGVKTYTCSVCSETKTEAIPKLAVADSTEATGGCGASMTVGAVTCVATVLGCACTFAKKSKNKED